MFQKISDLETAELLELRLEEVERQCLSLCQVVLCDEECNAAASAAKRWFASWPQRAASPRAINAKKAIAKWFSHGLRFGLCKALRGAMAPLSQETDLSALLYASIRPVALEVVYRNPEAGLKDLHREYLKRTGLNASKAVSSDHETIDATLLPEGISDEDLAMELTSGILEDSLLLALSHGDRSDLHHDLADVPRQYYSILQGLEDLLATLEGTGRLTGVKHRDQLMRTRKIVRHLSATAFAPGLDQDRTTVRVYRACRAALEEATKDSSPKPVERLLLNTAAAFAGRLLELAHLTEPRTEPTAQTRRERVFRAVSRVDERSRQADHQPGETPSGE